MPMVVVGVRVFAAVAAGGPFAVDGRAPRPTGRRRTAV